MEEIKFYEPFKRVSDVEPYINKEITYHGKTAEVIGVSRYNGILKIQIVMKDDSFEKIELGTIECFYACKCENHQLGKEM